MAEVKLIDRAPIKRSQWVTITLRKDANFVNIDIYAISGKLIRQEALGPMKAGSRQWFWDGRNDKGKLVSSGVYHCLLVAQPTDDSPTKRKSFKIAIIR